MQGSPVIQNCIFVDNEAGIVVNSVPLGGGGGAHLNGAGGESGGALLKFIDCSFLGNYSKNVAGGLCNSRDASTCVNCVFVANEAETAGGGIYDPGIGGEYAIKDVHLYNCTFYGNESPFGSAIDCESGTTSLSQILYMRNCIVWGNTGTGDQIEYNTSNSNIDIDYSDLEEAITGGGHNLSSDPLFEDVNGNDNVLGTTDDNVRIAGTSLARNQGLNSSVPEDQYDVDNDGSTIGGGGEKTPDRDRATRILNTTVDMGAYESHEGTTCCADINNNGCVNVDDLLHVVNNWGDSGVGDIAPECSGDGFILVDDLLAVINGWGNCSGYPPCDENAMPMSVGDCMEDADELYDPFSVEWQEFVADCVDALCKADIIDCDE
jgi:hypothetical protein